MGQRATEWGGAPPPSRLDALLLFLYLIPVGLAAAARALLWSLHLPMGVLFWSARTHLSWGPGDAWHADATAEEEEEEETDSRRAGTRGAVGGSEDSKGAGMCEDRRRTRGDDRMGEDRRRTGAVIKELVQRGAHRLPHTGGRPFVHHITGVGKLLEHWGQPPSLCLAGIAHSVYATEMYPCKLFAPEERKALRNLIGRRAEAVVFLYCTCSQHSLLSHARSLSRQHAPLPPEGLPVRNIYTGEEKRLPPRAAAQILAILAADLMEQDPYFDLPLALACLSLASPHLQAPPALISKLGSSFFSLPAPAVARHTARARALLVRARAGGAMLLRVLARLQGGAAEEGRSLEDALEAAAGEAPWLFELNAELARLRAARGAPDTPARTVCLPLPFPKRLLILPKGQPVTDCLTVPSCSQVAGQWAAVWGTCWSRVGTPEECLAYAEASGVE